MLKIQKNDQFFLFYSGTKYLNTMPFFFWLIILSDILRSESLYNYSICKTPEIQDELTKEYLEDF